MKPLQGAGRGDIKAKEREKKKERKSMSEREKKGGKCERRGMRNIQRSSRK